MEVSNGQGKKVGMENVLAWSQVPRSALRGLPAAQSLHGFRTKARRREAHPLAMPPRPLTRLRKMCLALPEAHEVEAWGEPTFRVRNKIFAMYASGSNHHGGGRHSAWCKSVHINQELLTRSAHDA